MTQTSWTALRDNWVYMIAALIIVSLLWVNLTADERQAQEVATLLEYEVLDSAWVLVDAPSEVSTTFQGRNRELLGLLMNEPVIRIAVSEVTGPSMRVPLDADLVSYDRELGVRPTLVVPMSVELRFEPLADRRVPVMPDVETIPAMGYTVVRPLLVAPESVTVRGPASEVERVTQMMTRRVSLENLEHPVMRDLPLVPPPGVRQLGFEPRSVLVTVPVDSLVIRMRRLPVRAVGPGAQAVSVRPDTVSAVVRGAWRAVQAQLSALTHAFVRVAEPLDAPASLELEVDLPEGGFVSVTLQPARATVRRRGS